MREFSTGATRDDLGNKLDYEGFLSPIVLEKFAEYMHKERVQSDGKIRNGDNWQKGIPKDEYMKSAWRHFHKWWKTHRKKEPDEESILALMFNCMGYIHELNRPKLYLSGKLTNGGKEKCKRYVKRFYELEEQFTKEGWDVMNPARWEQVGMKWKDYMRKDLALIRKYRPTMFMLSNWKKSKGARREYRLAKELGLMITFESL